MKWTCSEFTIDRAACAYFFICPGLTYGLLTSRLPALKAQTGADEAQIGLILLCFGLSGLLALLASAWLVARFGSRAILRLGSLATIAALPLTGLAGAPSWLAFSCALCGLGTGLTDVAMNAQGIEIERRHQQPCMSLMHASYSLGGVFGSLSGALFAGLGLGPLVNFACVLGLYACLRPLASPRLHAEVTAPCRGARPPARLLPPFVLGCGLLAMLAYAAEGSVAEWGSLLLFTVKGASEQVAALVFGVFSCATVIARLLGDRLRRGMGDFPLALAGALVSACGMALVLFSPRPALCLLGYAGMGAGLSPIVPILFSRAGSHPGVSPGAASAAISVLAYGGLLFFPPTLGWLAHRIGLDSALTVVLALLCLLAIGTPLIREKSRRPALTSDTSR